MTRRVNAGLAGMTAALVLLLAVGSASAGKLSISNQRIRAVWSALEFRNATVAVRCPVTLEGSFHSGTIRKIRDALIGYITRATAHSAACTNGHARFLQETLPWHMTYFLFEGTLPRISMILAKVIGLGVLLEIMMLAECLYGSTAARPIGLELRLNTTTGQVTSVRPQELFALTLIEDLGGLETCPDPFLLGGTGTVTLLGNVNAISIRLI
jgi:hypothetical protein